MTSPSPANSETPAPPLHGYRGAPAPPPVLLKPRALTVAISREAGSRGGTIAAAVGRLLGWTVYTQEMIDFLARDEAARQELSTDVPASARMWAETELATLPPGLAPAARRSIATLIAELRTSAARAVAPATAH